MKAKIDRLTRADANLKKLQVAGCRYVREENVRVS